MTKLVLFNLLVQLYISYLSLANRTEVPLSNVEKTTKASSLSDQTNDLNTEATIEEVVSTRFMAKETTTHFNPRKSMTTSDIMGKIFESDVREAINEMMDTFCPLADICDANTTSAELKPNGVLSRGRVSCCRGCSCHPDCKKRMNCCYPEDYESLVDAEQTPSPYQCLYTRLGQDQTIDGTVPAYRTIAYPPVDGCVDTRPFRVTPDVLLYPTCDDIDVTPLGSYSPVYSKETGDIYKNMLCALCHGIQKIESFKPILDCREVAGNSKLSLAEKLGFVNSKALSRKCHVDFIYSNLKSLKHNLCYKDLVSTCTMQNVTHITVRKNGRKIILDYNMISNTCEHGLISPTVQGNLVYKNIFCAICARNAIDRVPLLCEDDESYRTIAGSFPVLLDLRIMHTINKLPSQNGLQRECVVQQGTQNEVCRTIHCPSGKLHTGNGSCVLVGNFINNEALLVVIKLTLDKPFDINEPVTEQDNELLVKSVLEHSPWSKEWKVIAFLKRKDKIECNEKADMMVQLAPGQKDTEDLLSDINTFIQERWDMDWRNETYRLTQSLIEYKTSRIGATRIFIPSWQAIQRNLNISTTYSGCGLIKWNIVFANLRRSSREQYVLSRLYFCNQIEIRPEEYILGPDNTYLASNLTTRTLFDLEFELIENEDGVHARVCLDQTIFSTATENRAGDPGQPLLFLTVSLFTNVLFTILS